MRDVVYASFLIFFSTIPSEAAKISFACRGTIAGGQTVEISGSYILSNKAYFADRDVSVIAPGIKYDFYTRNIEVTSNGVNFRLDAVEDDTAGNTNSLSIRHTEGSAAGDDVLINIHASSKNKFFKYRTSDAKCRFR